MELKSGFKRTEVGIIPEDWELSTLGESCTFENGDRGKNYPSEKSYVISGFPFVNAGNVDGGRIRLGELNCISKKSFDLLGGGKFLPGDVLFCLRGSLGKFGVVDTDLGNGAIASSLIIVRPRKSSIIREYLVCYFSSSYCAKMIEKWSGGAAQPNLGGQDLARFSIPLPFLPEQRAIATALSDVDSLLAAQDKLIAKKRDIKQATMQQLLTGKQRLPGFTEKWEVKRLGEVFTISAGNSKSAYVAAGGRYWVVDMGSVSTGGKLIVSKSTNYHGDFLKLGDLVMPKDDIGGGGIIGKVGYIDADETYVLGDHVYRLSANMGAPLFLSYLINGHRTNIELRKKVIGSAQLGLGRKSVEEQEILFPSWEEQTAIATVLSDMDADITTLEQQRDKTRAIKQGMMQELLTGRIRLV